MFRFGNVENQSAKLECRAPSEKPNCILFEVAGDHLPFCNLQSAFRTPSTAYDSDSLA